MQVVAELDDARRRGRRRPSRRARHRDGARRAGGRGRRRHGAPRAAGRCSRRSAPRAARSASCRSARATTRPAPWGCARSPTGDAALTLAVAAIESGPRRPIDVGLVGGRPFLGSFAIGMDADVLSLRNRLHRRLAGAGVERRLHPVPRGLRSGACSAAHTARRRGCRSTASARAARLYNLAVVNTPIYAGPFRFDGANDSADGRLDVLAVASAVSTCPSTRALAAPSARAGRWAARRAAAAPRP